MKRLLLPLVLLTAVLTCPRADAAEEADPAKTGLPAGQKAPAFALKDQSGKEVSLESLLQAGPVALVFHRSADW